MQNNLWNKNTEGTNFIKNHLAKSDKSMFYSEIESEYFSISTCLDLLCNQ